MVSVVHTRQEANTQQQLVWTRRLRIARVAGTMNPRLHRSPCHPTMKKTEMVATKENRLRKRALTCIARDSGTLILCVMHFQTFPGKEQSNKLGRLRVCTFKLQVCGSQKQHRVYIVCVASRVYHAVMYYNSINGVSFHELMHASFMTLND